MGKPAWRKKMERRSARRNRYKVFYFSNSFAEPLYFSNLHNADSFTPVAKVMKYAIEDSMLAGQGFMQIDSRSARAIHINEIYKAAKP